MLARHNPSESLVQHVADGASLHSQDIQPSILVLGQAQSEGVTSGRFQRTDTQEEFETVQVVPLVVRPSRLKWPAGKFTRDMQPECWSDDGLVGSSRPIKDRLALFPGGECNACSYFTAEPWNVDKDQGWCLPGYNVLLMDASTYEVYLMRLRGSAAKVARMMVAKGIFQKAVVELSSALTQAATGTWYQLKARTLRRLGEDDLSLIGGMYRDYTASAVEGIDKEASTLAEETTPVEEAGLPADQRPRADRSTFDGVTPGMELPF